MKDNNNTLSFRNFIWKEMTIGNALSNGICNGLIYAIFVSNTATHNGYLVSTLIANIILGIIVINLYPYLIKLKLRKNPNIEIPYEINKHIVASLYPQNTAAIRIINIIICTIISTVLTIGTMACINIWNVGVIAGSIFRGIDCAVYSIFAYYFSMVFYTKENAVT